jgi:protein ImuB
MSSSKPPGSSHSVPHKSSDKDINKSVSQSTNKSINESINKSVKNNTQKKLWISLVFDQLALEILSRGMRPDDTRPVVITEKRRVYRASPAAFERGIAIGQSMDTAHSLSSNICLFDRDPDKEVATLSHLAQWAYQFTPNVAIKSPDCLLLDITGCLSLFKGIDNLSKRILDGLHQLGYHPVMAVNQTPLAALLLARFSTSMQTTTPSPATTTSKTNYETIDDSIDEGINAGVNVGINAGNHDSGHKAGHETGHMSAAADTRKSILDSIKHIPVQHLQTDAKHVTALQQMGIGNIEKVFDLPASSLRRRFDTYFADYLLRLVGDKSDPQNFISQKANFYHDITFASDVDNLNSLVFPVKRLLEELSDFLTARQLQTNQFTWHFCHRNHGKKSFSIHLANAENEPKAFMALSQLKLDQIDDIKEVDAIALSSNQLFSTQSETTDLFSDHSFSDSAFLQHGSASVANSFLKNQPKENLLLNMLHTRLGEEHCFRLALADDHRPEKSWQPLSAFKEPSASLSKEPSASLNKESLASLSRQPSTALSKKTQPIRPAFILQTPKALKMVENSPCITNKLTLIKGPERIDYGWWDKPLNKPLTRDYYIASQPDGSLYWIFKHAALDQWYLHGIFA